MYDLWPGTAGPASETPELGPGWTRRTTSVDMVRPRGPNGPLVLLGRGRDMRDGRVLDQAVTRVVVDFHGGREVVESSVAGLVGRRAGSGFRDVVPDDGSLESLLLDEVPVATLISRAALSDDGEDGRLPAVDVCAGWVGGGRLASSVLATRKLPPLRRPPAPDLAGFHELPPLPVRTMRRVRRIDVGPDGRVDSLFRDSLMHPDEGHVVVHEYAVRAVVVDGRVASMEAEAHVLPAPECPAAAASVERVVGMALSDIRSTVRATFGGTSTCTHLNDHVRALGDVRVLLP